MPCEMIDVNLQMLLVTTATKADSVAWRRVVKISLNAQIRSGSLAKGSVNVRAT